MIKTALKHWIYETCIEQIFVGINKNFKVNTMLSKNFVKPGDRFKRIDTVGGTTTRGDKFEYATIYDVVVIQYLKNIEDITTGIIVQPRSIFLEGKESGMRPIQCNITFAAILGYDRA